MSPSRRRRSVEGAVVAVTGATSGIGRATALLLARRGAFVALAARRREALQDLAAECEALGSPGALAVPTDVADPGAVEEFARRTVERFGRLDAWVNNALALAFGRFEEIPAETNRRVIETNLVGYANGAHAALRRFRDQDAGVLVNVSSGFGLVGSPYWSAYVATKFGQRGLSEALREETLGSGIHVCTVMPAAVDTPAYRTAANHSGRAVGLAGPAMSPERVAGVIVGCIERPRREVVFGGGLRGLVLLHDLAPAVYERLIRRGIESGLFGDEPAAPTDGNVFTPADGWATPSGGYTARNNGDSSGPRRAPGARTTALTAAGLAAGAAAGVALLRRLARL